MLCGCLVHILLFLSYRLSVHNMVLILLCYYNCRIEEMIVCCIIKLTLSKYPGQYWSKPPFLIVLDICALWRSVLSARVHKCPKKLKRDGSNQYGAERFGRLIFVTIKKACDWNGQIYDFASHHSIFRNKKIISLLCAHNICNCTWTEISDWNLTGLATILTRVLNNLGPDLQKHLWKNLGKI